MVIFFNLTISVWKTTSGGGKTDDDAKTFQSLLQKYGEKMSEDERKVLGDFATKLATSDAVVKEEEDSKPIDVKEEEDSKPIPVEEGMEEEIQYIANIVHDLYHGVMDSDNQCQVEDLDFVIAKDLHELCGLLISGDMKEAERQCTKLLGKYPMPPINTELDISHLKTDSVSNQLLWTADPTLKNKAFTIATTGNGSCFFNSVSIR